MCEVDTSKRIGVVFLGLSYVNNQHLSALIVMNKMFDRFLKIRKIVEFIPVEDSAWRSQRDNKLFALSACNVTSMVMAAHQAGYDVERFEEGGEQAEDVLMTICRSKPVEDFTKKNTPWAWNSKKRSWNFPPNEVHASLSFALNKMLDKDVSVFKTSYRLLDIAQTLLDSGGAVVSGVFELEDGRELGHVVSVSGIKYKGTGVASFDKHYIKEADIKGFYIDDPYGDYTTNYTNTHGNNIYMSISDFIRIFRKSGTSTKWAHLIRKAGS